MIDKKKQSELSEIMLWFGKNDQIPLDVRRMILAEYIETAELSAASINLIDRWLAFIEYESREKIKQLSAEYSMFNQMFEAEEVPNNSFSGSVLKQAEAEMMRVALKFKTEFDTLKKQRLEAAETKLHDADSLAVQQLRNQFL